MDPRARKVVSYADISPSIPDEPSSSALRPAKRARTTPPPAVPPASFTGRALNGSSPSQPKKQKRDPKSWQTSRSLTHDEIWDDSALVNAWDAAMEEYRAVNGDEKGWMYEPTDRSALWWNSQPAEDESYEEADEEYLKADAEEVEDELITTHVDPTPSSSTAVPSGLPSIPFLPSSQGFTTLPEDPDKVLELAIQSYYWAGYLMGRRDEMLRAPGGRPAAGPGPEAVNEDEEQLPEVGGEY
ncbi:hypothetical protein CALVIDRAFT_534147 [Calocera viscosa TUFC12733]|uniref:Survival Motor Neuron Gemin2-binding domain-containing protein n=1 Tax=Calocera viscosa (strain TUFC12733) TaxID=1330018 RepID=A0A167QFU4_CALVF|nr:hypothetical protein CALVIDRAFT_534147 [Calocera viscosa TUFC12733]